MIFITPLLILLTDAMARKQTKTGGISDKYAKRTGFTCTHTCNKTNQKHRNRDSPWSWMSPFTLCPLSVSVAQVSVLPLFPRAAAIAKILCSDCASSKNKVRS